jgi:hypothetical protein
MIPHKTARGAAAMNRLKIFEGVPPPYDKKQLMVVPQALRVLRLKPGRKYCTVGRLAHEVGWKYQDVVARYVTILHEGYQWDIVKSVTWLTKSTDSRREEKSRARRTTNARRLSDDTSQTPSSRPESQTRGRSWPNWATRVVASLHSATLDIHGHDRARLGCLLEAVWHRPDFTTRTNITMAARRTVVGQERWRIALYGETSSTASITGYLRSMEQPVS